MAPNDASVTLSTGAKMPKIGLGTWAQTNFVNRDQHDPKSLANAVKAAVEAGYRHIDTAWAYHNEKEIGEVLKDLFARGVCKREELFVTTKLYAFFFHPEQVEPMLKSQLADLGLDYIDLYLMHIPCGIKQNPDDPKSIFPVKADGTIDYDPVDHLETWKALESCVKKGLTKHIGVSNFNSKQIQNLIDNAEIKPHNLQVECHAYWPQVELHEYCQKNGISFTAYSPIGSPGMADVAKTLNPNQEFPRLMQDPVVTKMAEKYKKTPAQLLIRYLYQRDMVVIPKSTNADRIKQNAEITDFVLEDADMSALTALKKAKLLGGLEFLKDHPHYPYNEPF